MVLVLAAVVLAIVAFGGALGLLAALFRLQVRRYNRRAAAELLDEWAAWLNALDPNERARVSPPAKVLAAMAALPATGWRSSWTETPVTSFDRVPSRGR